MALPESFCAFYDHCRWVMRGVKVKEKVEVEVKGCFRLTEGVNGFCGESTRSNASSCIELGN